jgi:MoxR-like ATPase
MSDYQSDFIPTSYRLDSSSRASIAGQDVRDGSVYVYDDPITLAVRVALATGRPLLLLGPPGSGKSSLAAYVARVMNWNYFEQVVTSRTKAQDLLWSFDVVRRLRDAQAQKKDLEEAERYIEPRVLWWAFNVGNALRRGADSLPQDVKPPVVPGVLRGETYPSVVLIDEIDKADPDVPNDLLVSIGSRRFRVEDTGGEVAAVQRVLVFITSNNERSLPAAFLRRCVIYRLDPPTVDRLVTIAKSHFPSNITEGESALLDAVARRVVEMRSAEPEPGQQPPSVAEYLDAIRACLHFKLAPDDSALWKAISSAVLEKKTQGPQSS